MSSSQRPLSEFERLSETAYLYTPPSTVQRHPHHPALLILCSWMDAAPRHIAKYATSYINMFPSTPIILSTTTSYQLTMKSTPALQKPLQPALHYILSLDEEDAARIALAIYSNGGAKSATSLALAYRQKTGKALFVPNTVLDSAPGTPALDRAFLAIFTGLPGFLKSFPLTLISTILVWLFLLTYKTIHDLFNIGNPIDELRMTLNDTTVFMPSSRCYIYSKEDKLVEDWAVEEHASEAKRLGWDVTLERFHGSQHVAHAVKDKERYWELVKGCLER
jgi:hypothetical protein